MPGRHPAALARAFFEALFRRETYDLRRNAYLLYGVFWGVPVPFATLGIHLGAIGESWTPSSVARCLVENPWQWFFLFHPILFGVLFGALGTLARDRERRIDALVAELRVRADTDGLTGMLNQRAFYERCQAELARAGRTGEKISLLLLDIDHFKLFNDRYGHLAGDRALAALSQELRTFVRSYDSVARYGGEEFVVLLPGMGRAEAKQAAERFRLVLRKMDLSLPGLEQPRLTVSIGVAEWRKGEGAREWLSRADRRLYAAKSEGRDRVCDEDRASAKSRGSEDSHP